MKRKNETLTIYFGKERILSLQFEQVELELKEGRLSVEAWNGKKSGKDKKAETIVSPPLA